MSDIKRIESLEEYPCADPQYVSPHFWSTKPSYILKF